MKTKHAAPEGLVAERVEAEDTPALREHFAHVLRDHVVEGRACARIRATSNGGGRGEGREGQKYRSSERPARQSHGALP